jgi:hypothetical protein
MPLKSSDRQYPPVRLGQGPYTRDYTPTSRPPNPNQLWPTYLLSLLLILLYDTRYLLLALGACALHTVIYLLLRSAHSQTG